MKEKLLGELKKSFRPEFLNRIDDIIMFKPLTREEIKDVVRLQFRQLQNLLGSNGITITITEKAVELITGQGFDFQFGARPVKRIIQRNILNELSKMILSGTINKDEPVIIDREGENLLFRN